MVRGAAGLVRAILTHPIGSRQPIRTAARVLRWQLRSRISWQAIPHRWIADSVLLVEHGMTGATGNVYFGLHEFADMALVMHVLRAGDLMYDIGANVGSYTVLAAKVAGAHVQAFEPADETRPKLLANIAANRIESLVTVHNCALGERDGEVEFSEGLDTVNRIGAPGASRTVALRRLDSVAGALNPVMLKVDVEGYEPQLFAGAEAVLGKTGLRLIETETFDTGILAQLARHGFKRRYYDPFARSLSAAPVSNQANNALFVRDEDWVARRIATSIRYNVLGIDL